MRTFRLLNLRRARRQPLRLLIAVVAIAAGVGLAGSVLVVQHSFRRSFEDFARSFSGPAPLRVVGPASRAGLDEAVLPVVDGADGVQAAVPVVQAVTFANAPGGEDVAVVALGFDCRIEALIGDLGCSPDSIAASGPDSLPILSRRLAEALGPDGVVRTNLGPRAIRGALVVDDMDEVNRGHVVAYPLPAAQALFSRPQSLDAIYVLPETGVEVGGLRDQLQELVGGHNTVLTRDEIRSEVLGFVEQLVPFLGLISLFALAVGAVLVHNTFALSLAERRRDLALAGALGASPRTLVSAALVEAGFLGVIGGLLGAGVALPLARPILGGLQWFTERMSGLELQVHASPLPFVLGVVLGTATAVLAAVGPARRSVRVDVVAELQNREQTTAPGGRASIVRVLVLTAVGVGGLGIANAIGRGSGLRPSDPVVGQLAFIGAAVALSWAVGSAAPWIFATASRLFGRRSAPTRLAWTNLVREPRRASTLLVAASLVVMLGFAISSITAMVGDGIGAAIEQEIGDDLSVTTMPPSNAINLDARPSPELQAALRAVPGVRSVSWRGGVAVSSRSLTLGVEGVEQTRFPYEMLAGRLDVDAFQRGAVLIGPVLAREEGLGPGSTLRLPGRTGFTGVEVLGVWANGDFNGREVWMPRWLLEEVYGPQPPGSLGVEPEPGVRADELARRIEAAGLDPYLDVSTRAQVSEMIAEESTGFAQPFWAIQRGMMVVAFAAVLFTLLLVAVQRRRELGLMAAVGMPPGGLARMVLTEALIVGVVATLAGSVLGLAFIQAFRDVGFLIVPFRFPYRFDLTAVALYGAATTAILLAAAAFPAWRHSRLEVVDAIRYE